jgi:alkylation response protein AidB-like acyl-CoA dehydrogenase
MEFELNDEQIMFRDSVRRWAEKGYGFDIKQAIENSTGGFSTDKWKEMADLGWLLAGIPESAGGLGCSAIESAVIAEELGRALVLEPFVAVGVLAARTLEFADTTGEQTDLLTAIGTGETLVALAHNEHEAYGLVSYVTSQAEAVAEGWRLNGRKTAIIGGPQADRLIISARISGAADDRAGIALFVLDADAPGISRQCYRMIDGSPACDVTLENVRARAGDALGVPGAAYAPLARAHAYAIIALCAEALGVMDKALWITRDYMQTRQQFGVLIGSFQSLQHRAADMYVAVEQARAILNFGLANLEKPPAVRDRAISSVKAQIGQLGHFVCGQAIQLHGGIGLTEEYVIGHHFKRMTVIDSQFGSSNVHLSNLADVLRQKSRQ